MPGSDELELYRQQIEALKQRLRSVENENTQLKSQLAAAQAIIAANAATRGNEDNKVVPMRLSHRARPEMGAVLRLVSRALNRETHIHKRTLFHLFDRRQRRRLARRSTCMRVCTA